MSSNSGLPSYPEERLAGLEPAALIDLMLGDEDRVPRAVIDACARRGDAMVAALQDLAERPWAEREAPGAWWLRLHAVMILGLIPSEQAGLLLVRLMRRMAEAGDDNLQDSLSGDWPALFANKPGAVLPALHDLCGDRALDWCIRADAMDAVVASAERGGREALDETLAWVARIAADGEEHWDMRLSCGNMLLDFPRPQYRALVEDLAKQQSGLAAHFSSGSVERAYAALKDAPDWRGRDDPWARSTGPRPSPRARSAGRGKTRKRAKTKAKTTAISSSKSPSCRTFARRPRSAATTPVPAAAGRNTRSAACSRRRGEAIAAHCQARRAMGRRGGQAWHGGGCS